MSTVTGNIRSTRARLRRLAVIAATVTSATTLTLSAAAAAAPVDPATMSMTSEAGDYVGQGGAYHWGTPTDGFDTVGPGPVVQVAITTADGARWHVALAAPGGAQLAPGTYAGATRYPFQGPAAPGLSVTGAGRGCNTLTGSFEVQEARYSAEGTLTRLSASFVQHCEGRAPALVGSMELGEAPAPLALAVAIDPTGTANPTTAIVGGKLACSRAVDVRVVGMLEQWGAFLSESRGTFTRTVACSPKGTLWTAGVKASSGPAFGLGNAKLVVATSAEDARVSASSAVVLVR